MKLLTALEVRAAAINMNGVKKSGGKTFLFFTLSDCNHYTVGVPF